MSNDSSAFFVNPGEEWDRILDFFSQYHTKAVAVACNTASSIAKEAISLKTSTHIIDVIIPIQQLLAEQSSINKIGIIGTHNTIRSHAYDNAISK